MRLTLILQIKELIKEHKINYQLIFTIFHKRRNPIIKGYCIYTKILYITALNFQKKLIILAFENLKKNPL